MGVIIASMQQGETWTGGDAGCVVGDTEVGQKKTGFEELGRICNDKSAV